RLADVGAAASLRLIEDVRHRLDERFGPLHVRVSMTGEGYTGSVGLNAVVNDLLGSLSTAVLIIFGMLVVLLGSWRLGLLSIPPNIIPLAGTLAWMSMRGMHLNASTVIVFSISLGLAVDGSIHLLARYREEISLGLDRNAALLRAARGTGRAVVVSCVTLMVGFGVMLLSSFVPVQRFGELVGVTVGMCLLSTLIVQPALLRVWAPHTPPNRFRRKRRSARPPAPVAASASREEE
ncbi:MAG: MMPL family transporter, partial [Myxococcales bacterium]|nr:MMPL family transporter [Myxococcales bacterium]